MAWILFLNIFVFQIMTLNGVLFFKQLRLFIFYLLSKQYQFLLSLFTQRIYSHLID